MLWLRADLGITYVQGPVVATGTTPPTVTFAGTPSSSANSIVLTCTGAGTQTTATFSWTLNGAAQTPFTAAATVVLPGTGITATFPVGAYTNTPSADTYTSVVTVSAWADQSGHGNNATQGTAADQPAYSVIDAMFSGAPSLACAGSLQGLNLTSLPPNQPVTYYLICGLTAVAAAGVISDSAAGTCPLYWSGTQWGTTSNGGGNIFYGPTSPGSGVAGAFAVGWNGIGAGSSLWVNSSGSPTTGNAGTGNPSGIMNIGNSAFGSFIGKYAGVLIYSGLHTNATVARLFAYFATMYGTPSG